MKGRKPKPVEIHRRNGNPSNGKLPEPVMLAGRMLETPSAPAGLPEDGREVWDVIVPRLRDVGLLDQVDSFGLEAMCMQWARAREAGRLIEEEGYTATGSMGQLVEHPAVKTERAAHQMFLKFAEHYGLTSLARTRLGLAELQRRSLATEMAGALDDALVEVE